VEARKAGNFNIFMKNFITSMLGALVALVVFATGAVLLFIGFIGAIVSVGQRSKVPQLASGSYIVFDLATNITDAPPPIEFGDLTGERTSTLQLRSITRAIRHAAHDDKIKGILLLGNLSPGGYGTGYAALREVRAALKDFRESKKPVIAYIDYATVKDYYLASAANEIVLDPYGMLILPGIASQPMFLAGAFEKYGIGVQVTRVGKYKSYVEEFTRTDMSPENREQVQKLLDDVWGTLIADIGHSRGIDPKEIQATVDAEGLIKPTVALKASLIDKVAYRDEIIDRLKKETGVTSPTDSFKQVQLGVYAKNNVPVTANSFAGGEVAVIYAEGEIVEGEGDQNDIGGARFAREIRRLREDSSVKAIVLRVNSPGGSVTASETIQREIRLARKVKPVVVSMGSYAASGGYWISASSDRIFAEPTTITGSIGVFGIQFNIQKLANDHGVTFDSVKTGRFADSLTIARPQSPEELEVLQKTVDWVYSQFVAKVAEGRKLPLSRVEEIAQGRVWSGTEALKIGLVDEIGGLEAAVKFAAGLAKIGDRFHVVEYPRPKNLSEAIAEMLGRFGPTSLHLHSQQDGLVGQITARIEGELAWIKALNDPNGVYARMPVDLAIH
jgi:protease-4